MTVLSDNAPVYACLLLAGLLVSLRPISLDCNDNVQVAGLALQQPVERPCVRFCSNRPLICECHFFCVSYPSFVF